MHLAAANFVMIDDPGRNRIVVSTTSAPTGVDGKLLFETLSEDDGRLRPAKPRHEGDAAARFSGRPAPDGLRALGCQLRARLAGYAGHRNPGAEPAREHMEKARAAGFADACFPALIEVVDRT